MRLRDQPLAWLAGAWMLGVWIWPWLRPGWVECALGASVLALIGYRRQHSWLGWVSVCLASVMVGFMALSLGPERLPTPGPAHERAYVLDRVGRHALVETARGRRLLRFSGDVPATGDEIIAWWEPEPVASSLPGAWNLEGIRIRARAEAGRVRDWHRLGGPNGTGPELPTGRHEALLRALLIGDVGGLEPEQEALLRRTGTRHLVAVSGLHLGLVAGLAGVLVGGLTRSFTWIGDRFWWRVPRISGGIAAVLCASAYASLVGWPVSARRALYMIAATSVAICLGRRVRGWSLLGFAACAVVFFQPWQISRPAFLLSFGAVAGILGLTPTFSRWIPPDLSLPVRWTLRSLCFSLAASLGTLPISAWVFQEWAPVGPVANLLAGPLVSFWIVPCAVGAVGLPGDLGALALVMAEHGLDLLVFILRLMDLPLWHPAVGPTGALLLGLALCVVRHPVWSVALAAVALDLRIRVQGDWVLSFLAVGQGDSTLVEWPDGKRWLVDGGPPSTQVLHWLRREGLDSLDVVVLTHPDQDHLGGLLPVMQELSVDELWLSRPPRSGETSFVALVRAARSQGTQVRVRGDIEDPRVLPAPSGCDSDNECGLVLELRVGDHGVLLTGDIGVETEAALAACIAPVDVLKVGHHGSNGSSSEAFIQQLQPRTSVISVGSRNVYGHPGLFTLGRLSGSRILRTDQLGTIEVRSDGNDIAISNRR